MVYEWKFRLKHTHSTRHLADAGCETIAQIKCGTWDDDTMVPPKGMPPATLRACPNKGVGMGMRLCKGCDPGHQEGQCGTKTFHGSAVLPPDFNQRAWHSASIKMAYMHAPSNLDLIRSILDLD